MWSSSTTKCSIKDEFVFFLCNEQTYIRNVLVHKIFVVKEVQCLFFSSLSILQFDLASLSKCCTISIVEEIWIVFFSFTGTSYFTICLRGAGVLVGCDFCGRFLVGSTPNFNTDFLEVLCMSSLSKSEVESSRTSLASRTDFEVLGLGLGLEGQVLGLGLEASSPRKLACPRLKDSTIFWKVKILWSG